MDASQDAFGVVVYRRSVFLSELISSVIVAVKKSVGPPSAIDIPRLELMRMTVEISKALIHPVQCSGELV